MGEGRWDKVWSWIGTALPIWAVAALELLGFRAPASRPHPARASLGNTGRAR
jgi:hypothetical protein